MPTYNYAVRDKHGVLQTGHLDAAGEDEVLTTLQNRGLIVTSISKREAQATAGGAPVQSRRKFHNGAKLEDMILFAEQLSVLLESSIPLLKSLQVITNQVESKPLFLALEQIRQDIEGGKTFRDAMAKHPKLFNKFWVNLVGNGEASGHLGTSLEQVSKYLESVRKLQSKAITALTYPIILLVVAVGAVLVFVIFVIPVFVSIFETMNIELPLITQMVVNLSKFIRKYWYAVGGAAMGVGWLFQQFARSEQGGWVFDRLALKVPVFNQLFIEMQIAQFAQGLATLLVSGVPILYSLEIMEHGASNRVYGKAIGEIRGFVREGKTMAGPMGQTGLFPAMVVQMVEVGEEIGQLDKMLGRIAKYYEQRVDVFLDRLSVLFEPIAIMFIAVVIGTLVLAMFMPIFKLAGSANG